MKGRVTPQVWVGDDHHRERGALVSTTYDDAGAVYERRAAPRRIPVLVLTPTRDRDEAAS
jgi:hypothetical protein